MFDSVLSVHGSIGHPELVSGSVRGEGLIKARGEMLKQVQHDGAKRVHDGAKRVHDVGGRTHDTEKRPHDVMKKPHNTVRRTHKKRQYATRAWQRVAPSPCWFY